jgi:8-oxo-dGTP pyrophosphatase MutT (NUDIX family)|tara:strand:+ start:210 stop:596 length:387 start_codon:yes stop_codon:yes gene_type:complete
MAAAGVIIKYGRTVLLCKRSNVCNFAGYWSIPAGAVERGETVFEAAERELLEETKIKIERPLVLVLKTQAIRSQAGGDEPFHIYRYDVDELPYPELDFEHTEYGWFDLGHLPSPMCKNIIKAVRSVLK